MRTRLTFLACAAALVACGGAPPPGPCEDTAAADYTCDATPTVVKTSELYAQVITPDCVSTCHKPQDASSFPYGDFTSAAAFQTEVGKLSLYAGSQKLLQVVEPRKLQNSSLWLKVAGGSTAGRKGPNCESPGASMPQGSTLTDAKKKLIKDWICSGAQP